ncbi:MAG: YceI family protein [Acidobacteriota bacterium]
MIRKIGFAWAAALVLAGASAADAQTWNIDTAHSAAQFAVRHNMVSTVRGDLGAVTGTVIYDGKNLAAAVIEATIDVTGIDTRNEKRDAHLKTADFFDVANHPTMTFTSTKVIPVADGRFQIVGNLTIRGVTKEVTLDAEPLRPVVQGRGGSQLTGTTASTKINRKDFGVSWNRVLDLGGVVVGDDVSITIDVELVLPAAK